MGQTTLRSTGIAGLQCDLKRLQRENMVRLQGERRILLHWDVRVRMG